MRHLTHLSRYIQTYRLRLRFSLILVVLFLKMQMLNVNTITCCHRTILDASADVTCELGLKLHSHNTEDSHMKAQSELLPFPTDTEGESATWRQSGTCEIPVAFLSCPLSVKYFGKLRNLNRNYHVRVKALRSNAFIASTLSPTKNK